MLARGFKQYADVSIEANGMEAIVGFKVNKVRGAMQLTGYWRFPDGEWQRLNDKPISGKGAKAKIVQLGRKALEQATKSAAREKRFRETQVFVICGPSCGGKSTLKETLIRRHRNKFQSVVTTTTRRPRDGESPGVDYNFVSKERFLEELDRGGFLEHDRVSGEFYGVAKSELARAAESGRSPVIVATPSGIEPIRDWCLANGRVLTTVFVTAPAHVLIERMILRFRADSEASSKAYAARLERLINKELRWNDGVEFDIIDDTSSRESRERTVSRVLGVCEIGLIRQELNRDAEKEAAQSRLLA